MTKHRRHGAWECQLIVYYCMPVVKFWSSGGYVGTALKRRDLKEMSVATIRAVRRHETTTSASPSTVHGIKNLPGRDLGAVHLTVGWLNTVARINHVISPFRGQFSNYSVAVIPWMIVPKPHNQGKRISDESVVRSTSVAPQPVIILTEMKCVRSAPITA